MSILHPRYLCQYQSWFSTGEHGKPKSPNSPDTIYSPDLSDAYDLSDSLDLPDSFDSTDPHYACSSPFFYLIHLINLQPHASTPRCSVQSYITVEIYTLWGGRGNLGKQTDTIGTTRAFSLQNLKCDTKPDLSPENQISINTSLQILLVVSTTGL